jgi:hypothetical protein
MVTLLLLCLIIETLGSKHTSRSLLHVPVIENLFSHLIKENIA